MEVDIGFVFLASLLMSSCFQSIGTSGSYGSLETSWISSPSLKRGLRSVSSQPNVEILIVVDQSMVDYHGEADVTKYSLTIMNMVSKMYRNPSIGIPVNIVVVKVLMADKVFSDSFIVVKDAKMTLKSFCSWQKRQNPLGDEDPFHYDHAILLTRVDICAVGNYPCSTVVYLAKIHKIRQRSPNQHCSFSMNIDTFFSLLYGYVYQLCDGTNYSIYAAKSLPRMAMFGGMCNVEHSCSVVQDTGLNAAFTVAQMIANSFGMQFDDKTSCRDDHVAYIMSMKRTNAKETAKLKWSLCSKQSLKEFFRKPISRCLIDKPMTRDLDSGPQFVKLPGEIYNLDEQCRLNFGKDASFCKVMYGFACRMLWCHRKSGLGGCTTSRWGAADGTQCGRNRWCMRGYCVPSTKSEPVTGSWGNWNKWSSCSRTCGGGIQKSFRECDSPRPAHGGDYCKGERRRIRVCNQQECPSNTPDYRSSQCSSFDTSFYGGRQFKWTSFYSPAQECSLVCKASGIKYYRTMATVVADGTPCRPASYDRCVDGICLAIGCDNKIGSEAKEDQCGVCLGNGSTCTIIEDAYRNPKGIGYKKFLTIQSGSTNIAIREEKPSTNYLAIFDNKNTGILNGHYRIERPGIYHRAGTILQYKRRGRLEGIWIKGPLKNPIKVAILFQTNNSGVWYKYAQPKKLLSNRIRSMEKQIGIFLWRQSYDNSRMKWTKCSTTCGKGHRIAVFECVDAIQDRTVNSLFCSLKEKPELVQECQLKECPLPNAPVEWKRSDWARCSRSCGTGYQRRSVYCIRTDTKSLVNYRLCTGKKPRTVQTCNVHDCSRGVWKTGEWSECSVQCGNGTRHRLITCTAQHGANVDPSLCESHEKPSNSEPCQGSCVRWVTGEWNKCSSCSEKQFRCVICIHIKTFQPSALCTENNKPSSERECEKSSCEALGP